MEDLQIGSLLFYYGWAGIVVEITTDSCKIYWLSAPKGVNVGDLSVRASTYPMPLNKDNKFFSSTQLRIVNV